MRRTKWGRAAHETKTRQKEEAISPEHASREHAEALQTQKES